MKAQKETEECSELHLGVGEKGLFHHGDQP